VSLVALTGLAALGWRSVAPSPSRRPVAPESRST
jgi:hypothetical protein